MLEGCQNKPITPYLNQELLTIEQAIKSDPDLGVRQRAQIIRLLHKGYKRKEFAGPLSIPTGPVYYNEFDYVYRRPKHDLAHKRPKPKQKKY